MIGVGLLIAGSEQNPTCSLRVELEKSTYLAGERIVGMLSVTNNGDRTVAVARPRFPSAWEITRHYQDNGKRVKENWEGGIIRGSTHQGEPPRYDPDEYALISPLDSYREEIDLAWYLRNQRKVIPTGDYEVEFFYDHKPNESERDLPLIVHTLTSNVLRVTIAGK